MPSICFYFQVHQPNRLRHYTFFDIGNNSFYEDDTVNHDAVRKTAKKCYLPMNALLLELIKAHKGKFRASFSITGTALDQFERFCPEVLASFKALADTGCVEFIAETYYHSMAFLHSPGEFEKQIALHCEAIEKHFGQKPVSFRNTELIYNNALAKSIEDLGFETILAEGADHVLGWRSPHFVYQPASCKKLRLLLRNYKLSDDIALRFSDPQWAGFPLTADTFASWVHALNTQGETINLFMDYQTFGERHNEQTGIFDFMRALPACILKHPDFCFQTPCEVSRAHSPLSKLDVPDFMSWADLERDLTAWQGNDMQCDAMESLFRLESRVCAQPQLLKIWRALQSSEYFYYMCTKWFADGNTPKYYNPYQSPYDAYITFMNVLGDFELTLGEAERMASQKAQLPALIAEKSVEAKSIKRAAPKKSTKLEDSPAKKSASKSPRKTSTEKTDAPKKVRTDNPEKSAALPKKRASRSAPQA